MKEKKVDLFVFLIGGYEVKGFQRYKSTASELESMIRVLLIFPSRASEKKVKDFRRKPREK